MHFIWIEQNPSLSFRHVAALIHWVILIRKEKKEIGSKTGAHSPCSHKRVQMKESAQSWPAGDISVFEMFVFKSLDCLSLNHCVNIYIHLWNWRARDYSYFLHTAIPLGLHLQKHQDLFLHQCWIFFCSNTRMSFLHCLCIVRDELQERRHAGATGWKARMQRTSRAMEHRVTGLSCFHSSNKHHIITPK